MLEPSSAGQTFQPGSDIDAITIYPVDREQGENAMGKLNGFLSLEN